MHFIHWITMKFSPFLLLSFLLIFICSCWCRDLIVGTSYNGHLVWQQKAEYMGIPFKKRVKEFFYADPSQQTIRGIIMRDLDHTESTAIITAGGVGTTYANVRLKSERGGSLNYQMEIYV